MPRYRHDRILLYDITMVVYDVNIAIPWYWYCLVTHYIVHSIVIEYALLYMILPYDDIIR